MGKYERTPKVLIVVGASLLGLGVWMWGNVRYNQGRSYEEERWEGILDRFAVEARREVAPGSDIISGCSSDDE